jgi:hypothetical protein
MIMKWCRERSKKFKSTKAARMIMRYIVVSSLNERWCQSNPVGLQIRGLVWHHEATSCNNLYVFGKKKQLICRMITYVSKTKCAGEDKCGNQHRLVKHCPSEIKGRIKTHIQQCTAEEPILLKIHSRKRTCKWTSAAYVSYGIMIDCNKKT